MPNNDDWEGLIDGELSRYADAEPLAGLDERVLRKIRLERSGKRWFAAGVWAVVAVAVCVMVTVTVKSDRQIVATPTIPIQKAAVEETGPLSVDAARVVVRRRAKVARALPKQDIFPMPTPLTVEERALLAFVRRNPDGAARAFEDMAKWADSPIEIKPIAIEPLSSGDGQFEKGEKQ